MGTAVDRDWRFVSGRSKRSMASLVSQAGSGGADSTADAVSAVDSLDAALEAAKTSSNPRPRHQDRLRAGPHEEELWHGRPGGRPLDLLGSPGLPASSPLLALKSRQLSEQKRYAELAQAVRQTVTLKDIAAFLHSFPVDDLIQAVPKSLSLLEAVYSKFYLLDRRGFPRELLKPEKLLSQLLWWAAEEESGGGEAGGERAKAGAGPGQGRPELAAHRMSVMAPHVRTLLRIVDAVAPLATLALNRDRDKLEAAIEGLGLHGLVNCGHNKLIEVTDAVRIELSAHVHQMKLLSGQMDKTVAKEVKAKEPMTMFLYSINGLGKAPVPCGSSHQRLMKLRVTDVERRLERNQATLKVIQRALSSADLESLGRILEKRVAGDEALLEQFSALLTNPNPSFAIASANPVVAEVLVHFKAAYEALLRLLPPKALPQALPEAKELPASPSSGNSQRSRDSRRPGDSGFGDADDDHSNDDERHSPTQPEDPDQFIRSKSGRRLGPVAALISSKTKRSHHRSLGDFGESEGPEDEEVEELPPPPPFPLSPSRSLHNIHLALPLSQASPRGSPGGGSRGPSQASSLHEQGPGPQGATAASLRERMWGYGSGGESSTSGLSPVPPPLRSRPGTGAEGRRMAADLQRLQTELELWRERCGRLETELEAEGRGRERRLFGVEPSASLLSSSSSSACSPDLADAVQRFNALFSEQRQPLCAVLDTLPELKDAQDLQMKILFTVMVLSFRSISDLLEEGWDKVQRALEVPPLGEGELKRAGPMGKRERALKTAVLGWVEGEARSGGGMRNAKEVTRQLWDTLFDFPSLAGCTAFNRWVLECVDVGWALAAASGGSLRLAFDDADFDGQRHLRFHSSSLRSPAVRRFLWPALLLHNHDPPTVLAKAIVIT